MTAPAATKVVDGPPAGFPAQGRRSTFSGILIACLALIGTIALTLLGIWQLERRVWKLDLIDRVEQRIHAAPEPLPAPSTWAQINAADDAYRRIRVRGRFLHDREALVQAVTALGSGFWVLTPLVAADGVTVLVNRGFVPPERRDTATRRQAQSQGEVEVTGLMRVTEPKGAFLRNNDPTSDRWYSRDVAAIATARGLEVVAPFFIDADANPEGWPRGGLTVVAFPNNHLVYALTWFALAMMLAVAALYILREQWRSRDNDLDIDLEIATGPIPGHIGCCRRA